MQKEVKIIGLSLNQSLGILNATKLVFNQENKLIVFKGAVGEGKTTLQKGMQLGTLGSKTLTDNQLYGEIDTEVQLVDGDLPLWVGCRNNGKKLTHTLYTKDINGKKIKDPVIDGVKATPSSYLAALQTALTWRMDELTSENPAVQKKILLQLYQSQLSKIGVIFDKMHPDYGKSILGKIDMAVKNRDEKDFLRKQSGGIADDLKAQGFDPDRPDTCPDFVPIDKIEAEIKKIEAERTTLLAAPEEKKKADLSEIKANAMEITNKCLGYNKELQDEYDVAVDFYSDYLIDVQAVKDDVAGLTMYLENLNLEHHLGMLENEIKWPKEIKDTTKPNYINFDDNGNVTNEDIRHLSDEGKELVNKIQELRNQYSNTASQEASADVSKFDNQIIELEEKKKNGLEINKIVTAIDSFHYWREANEDVVRLKDEYVKLLSQVDTGVIGLRIEPIENDIFLMYDGSYDIPYFQPKDKKPVMRKLSSYSGTQKPVICLLIQNYLLSKKPKAMRYMYIDNIPIDNKTRSLLEKMTEELNLNIFLNITGDFEKNNLQAGEILIEGGQVFFNK